MMDRSQPEGLSGAIRVRFGDRGVWEVTLPDQGSPVSCDTLDAARDMAYACAARRQPCELIVCDAYRRVLHREWVSGRTEFETRRGGPPVRPRSAGAPGRSTAARPSVGEPARFALA